MLKIGSLVDGKYRVLSEIGHGGMSVVYMAINEKANKTWAIKEVRKDGIKDFEVVRQGLIVETEMLKRLSHPNLPSIVDVIENEDTFLIVMDYIEGNPLSKSLEEFGAQPQEYVIDWAKQLCDVLDYLHTRNPAIIYRDMKPANIMLKPDGNITLIDFGTAREFKEKNLADTTCLGTVGYAAPEQFGGMGQTDARTDIYCLGATLYHLVTGCNPCEPPYEILPIRSINPQLSSGLERIIIKCTQRNPEDRYQSCAELMYALEHYEEIDDKYRKQQKKKLNIFITFVALMLVSLLGAFSGIFLNNKQIKNLYEEYFEKGRDISNTYEVQNKNLIDAINTGYSDSYAAFVELISRLYSSDGIIDQKEFENIRREINKNINVLKDVEKADVSYRVACSLFEYYSDDGTSNNSIKGSTHAKPWFEAAVEQAANINQEDFDKIKSSYSEKEAAILIKLGTFSELLSRKNGQESGSRLIKNDDEKTIEECWKYLTEGFKSDINDSEISNSFKNMICQYGSYMLYSNTASMKKSLGKNYDFSKILDAFDEMISYLKTDNSNDAKKVLQTVQTAKKMFNMKNDNQNSDGEVSS